MLHAAPGMKIGGRQGCAQAMDAADVVESDEHQRQKSGNDEGKLEHLVVNGTGEPAEEDVAQDDDGRKQHGKVEDPSQRQTQHDKQTVEDVQGLDEPGHGIHGDAGGEYRHHGKGTGIQRTGLFIEAKAEKLRHGTGLRAVVERHHEDADEDHGRNGTNPVEMAGCQAVFGSGGTHADDFLRAKIGTHEGQATDPGRKCAACLKEILAGLHVALEGNANAQYKDEVQQHDQPVNGGELSVSKQIRVLFLGSGMCNGIRCHFTLPMRRRVSPAKNENLYWICFPARTGLSGNAVPPARCRLCGHRWQRRPDGARPDVQAPPCFLPDRPFRSGGRQTDTLKMR